jgi:hypothetical protein
MLFFSLDRTLRLWKPKAVKALIALLLIGATAQAQTPGQATPHMPDGGVHETLISIAVPPLTNAPFTAVVTTEWTKLLPDGTKSTMKNHRTIARDSSGRIFEERRFFSPDGDIQPTRLNRLQYLDPNRHDRYDCDPEQKICTLSTYRREALTKMPAGVGGLEACGCGAPQGASVKQEGLGTRSIEDIQIIGSRQVTTYAKGAFGNEKPEPVVKEFWYAPTLGLNLITKRFDPRSGIENFTVDHISLDEPDPKMFLPPANYEIVKSPERAGSR